MIQILISLLLLTPPKGLVITTIKSNLSDSCRVTVRLESNQKDTIVYFPNNKCPEVRDVVTLK